MRDERWEAEALRYGDDSSGPFHTCPRVLGERNDPLGASERLFVPLVVSKGADCGFIDPYV